METKKDIKPDEEDAEEIDDQSLDALRHEVARIYDEVLHERCAYSSTNVQLPIEPKMYMEDEEEYVAPELSEPEQETLPAGEMKLFLENSYTK